jgi:hypothetical protein
MKSNVAQLHSSFKSLFPNYQIKPKNRLMSRINKRKHSCKFYRFSRVTTPPYHLKRLTTHKWCPPVTSMRLLAIVNYLENATSDISYQSEVGREQQLYVISNEFFGYVLSDENELTLRIGFQNIGGMPVAKSKKNLNRDKAYQNYSLIFLA